MLNKRLKRAEKWQKKEKRKETSKLLSIMNKTFLKFQQQAGKATWLRIFETRKGSF